MSLIQGNSIEGAGYEIQKSLRFRASASAYLSRTPSVAGNRKTWTWSGWLKRGTLGAGVFFMGGSSQTDTGGLACTFYQDQIYVQGYNTNFRVTSQVFRDPSAWYHVVIAFDSTQATANNRCLIYINGVVVTAFATNNAFTQNTDYGVNQSALHTIGYQSASFGSYYLDGYLSEINFIDGQALGPSYFGEFSSETGAWIPKKYTGTYGTNGFYLPFNDGSTLGNLAADRSGNGNNWTANNISLTAGSSYDWMDDTPTNNYAVLNTLDKGTNVSVLDASLNMNTSAVNYGVRGSIGVNSGKWYWEVLVSAIGSTNVDIGVADSAWDRTYVGSASSSWGYFSSGQKYNNGTATAYGATYTTNDVVGVAFDADAGTLTFYKNGTSQGQAFSSVSGSNPIFPAVSGQTSSTLSCNFGQRPFAYTPPTGFKALCTKNLPTPSILNPKKHFDVALYTTTGSPVTVTTMPFDPGWMLNKARNLVQDWFSSDEVTGWDKYLSTNLTAAQGATTYITSADSGSVVMAAETAGRTRAIFGWKAGGTAVSNTAGSITSQVSANTSAGFSIVTYTGTGTNATVGHGLGVAPKMVIVKARNSAGWLWPVYHASVGNTGYLRLNATDATTTDSGSWQNTSPTSTVFSIGTSGHVNFNSSTTYVAYCFSEVAGFSKFGSYTGNGSADGPFVYCGFRPRFVMVKNASGADDWFIKDTSRSPYNTMNEILYPNNSNAEGSRVSLDCVSNGFKIRDTASNENTNGSTYIYMAFAENPFKYSNAR